MGSRLSTRLLILTALFVLSVAWVIFLPGLMRYRYLQMSSELATGYTAALAAAATAPLPNAEQQDRLLKRIGMIRVELDHPDGRRIALAVNDVPQGVATYALPRGATMKLLRDTFASLFRSHSHIARMIGPSPQDKTVLVDIVIDEATLDSQIRTFAKRMTLFLLAIALTVAGAAFFVLRSLILAPLSRLADSMVAFREQPDNPDNVIAVSGRRDEIGVAESELAAMQTTVRQTLGQQGRLAALGEGVSKINHDLRGILSTARLVSDRLAESDDPIVKKSLPPLLSALDRAVRLCRHTLDFAVTEPVLRRTRFSLQLFIDDVAAATASGKLLLINEVPSGIFVHADRDQLFRAFSNLINNTIQAKARRFSVGVHANEDKGLTLTVMDDGIGIPDAVQADLFQPFAGRIRNGGTGLGLAIVREVIRGHGGSISLKSTGAMGTVFEIVLPRSAITSAPKIRAARRWGGFRTIDGSKGDRVVDGR